MRHHNSNRKFGRTAGKRSALLKSLVYALVTEDKITTSEAKAKELRPIIEKMITRAKNGDVASRRILLSRLNNNEILVTKLISEIAPKYKDRQGGYTRITKLAPRAARADASPMAVIEFI